MKINLIKKLVIWTLLFSIAFANIHFSLGPGDNIKKSIAVIGDSYAEYFRDFIGGNDIEYYFFPRQGLNNPENANLIVNCLNQNKHDFVLFAVGASDYLLKNDPAIIEKSLREYIKVAEENNKYIFFHTYMNFPNSKAYKQNVFPPHEYDEVFKKLADEFFNVFYIDMNNLNNEHFYFGDGTHFNDLFYLTLYSKLLFITGNIETNIHTYTLPWMKNLNKNEIAVVGDTYAKLFFNYERDKDIKLLDFSTIASPIAALTQSMINATNSSSKYIVLSFGVVDHELQTDLNTFDDILRQFLNLTSITHKNIFIHSYMFYQASKNLPIKTEKYDEIVKKLCDEYPNATYIDTHSYEVAEYQNADLKNYNKLFNDSLYNTIRSYIEIIE